jgi:hypothetical protein
LESFAFLEQEWSGFSVDEDFVAAFFEVFDGGVGSVGGEFGKFDFGELNVSEEWCGPIPVNDGPELVLDGDEIFEVIGDDSDEEFDGYGEFGVFGVIGDEEVPVSGGDDAIFGIDDFGFDIGDDGDGFVPGGEGLGGEGTEWPNGGE